MRKMLFSIMILSTFLLGSCSKEIVGASTTSDFIITSGQSFGMCVGPCHQELIIEQSKAKFRVLTRPNRGSNGNASETIFQDALSQSEINEISQLIDFEKFLKLEKVYGCPDCADGGSEWIEVQKGETIYRVTFEFGKSVKEIEKLITLLREKRTKLSEKYVK